MWRVNGSPHIGMWLFPQAPGDLFTFPWRHRKLLKDQTEGFWLFLFSKWNIYLFESPARRLQVIQMPLQDTYLQAKVIEVCVWLPSSFLTWMLDWKNRKRTTWEMRKLFNLNGIPPRISRGNIPQSIHLGCWLSLHTSLLSDVIGVLGHQLVRECSPPIYIMPGQDDDDRDLLLGWGCVDELGVGGYCNREAGWPAALMRTASSYHAMAFHDCRFVASVWSAL